MDLAPIPIQTPVTERQSPYLSEGWFGWFLGLTTQVNATPSRVGTNPALTGQTASIGTTALSTPTLTEGLYRVSTYARVTTAASTFSSLQVSIAFTSGGVSCSLSGTAQTGNTTGTVDSNVWVIQVDQASPVSYATTYASVGGTAMAYRLDVVLERVTA